jgi:hypothetical protein
MICHDWKKVAGSRQRSWSCAGGRSALDLNRSSHSRPGPRVKGHFDEVARLQHAKFHRLAAQENRTICRYGDDLLRPIRYYRYLAIHEINSLDDGSQWGHSGGIELR